MTLSALRIAGQLDDLFIILTSLAGVFNDTHHKHVINKAVLQDRLDIIWIVVLEDLDLGTLFVVQVTASLFFSIALVDEDRAVLFEDDADALVFGHEFALHDLNVPRAENRIFLRQVPGTLIIVVCGVG